MSNGIGIVIAWPETMCKQAGAWYDKPLKWVGINQDNYYKVGHAATVLIEQSTGQCLYFDFGRYHTPHQHGRVRNALTDHDLEIKTIARFDSNGNLLNYEEILAELLMNESCHGSGNLHASYTKIHFKNALKKANEMQVLSPLPYGPFVMKGTNCSRFVNSVLIAGKPSLIKNIRLMFPKTFSPTPLGNVKTFSNYHIMSKEYIVEKKTIPQFSI